jgi:hypothetical protein
MGMVCPKGGDVFIRSTYYELTILERPNELKLSRGYLRARLRCSEHILIAETLGNKPGRRRLQRLP